MGAGGRERGPERERRGEEEGGRKGGEEEGERQKQSTCHRGRQGVGSDGREAGDTGGGIGVRILCD